MVEQRLRSLPPDTTSDLRAFLEIAGQTAESREVTETLALWIAEAAPGLQAVPGRDAHAGLSRVRAWVAEPSPSAKMWNLDLRICRTEALRLQALAQQAELMALEAIEASLGEAAQPSARALGRDFVHSLIALLAAKVAAVEPWSVHDLDSAGTWARAQMSFGAGEAGGDPARHWEWKLRRAGSERHQSSEAALVEIVAGLSRSASQLP
jgi:hypothetical protein